MVAGKWLAAWLTAVVVFTPALVFVGVLYLFGDPDPGPVAAGFLGLALFTSALTAFGVLASSLSSSQPVAAIIAMFTALIFWFAHLGSETGTFAPPVLDQRAPAQLCRRRNRHRRRQLFCRAHRERSHPGRGGG
jgi:hypothetical protein